MMLEPNLKNFEFLEKAMWNPSLLPNGLAQCVGFDQRLLASVFSAWPINSMKKSDLWSMPTFKSLNNESRFNASGRDKALYGTADAVHFHHNAAGAWLRAFWQSAIESMPLDFRRHCGALFI